RTAQTAVAQIPAAAHVARNHRPVQAQLFAAAAQYIVVGIGLRGPALHPEALLHALEPGRHALTVMANHPVLAGPLCQRLVRGAEAGSPVHQGGTTYGAALQYGNGAVLGQAAQTFLIQGRIGLVLLHAEVAAGEQPAFLDQQYPESGGAENLRAGGSPGAAA